MIIHLIGSMRHFSEDLPYMRAIASAIHNNDSHIALNWYESVESRKNRQTRTEESLDWEDMVTNNTNAVISGDALIIEGSRFNYSQGYQTALALQNNKPILNLYRKELKEYKEWPDKLFVSGISHPLFTSTAYKSEADIKKIVANFIDEHTPRSKKLTVDIVLENDIYEKLERRAEETGYSLPGLIKNILSNYARKME